MKVEVTSSKIPPFSNILTGIKPNTSSSHQKRIIDTFPRTSKKKWPIHIKKIRSLSEICYNFPPKSIIRETFKKGELIDRNSITIVSFSWNREYRDSLKDKKNSIVPGDSNKVSKDIFYFFSLSMQTHQMELNE